MDNPRNNNFFLNKKELNHLLLFLFWLFLITACYLVYQDNQLKKEISENCGFEKDDYECFCKKSDVEFYKGQHFPTFPIVGENISKE